MRELLVSTSVAATEVVCDLYEGNLSEKVLKVKNEGGRDVIIEIKSRFITEEEEVTDKK